MHLNVVPEMLSIFSTFNELTKPIPVPFIRNPFIVIIVTADVHTLQFRAPLTNID